MRAMSETVPACTSLHSSTAPQDALLWKDWAHQVQVGDSSSATKPPPMTRRPARAARTKATASGGSRVSACTNR